MKIMKATCIMRLAQAAFIVMFSVTPKQLFRHLKFPLILPLGLERKTN